MPTASLIIGIISIIGMLVAFIPCLGWLNWFVLPMALIGLILGIVSALSNEYNKNYALTAIILCAITLVFGSIRWVLGGFFL